MPLRSNLSRIRAGLQDAAARGVARGGGMIVDLAQQLCPVRTGALRASIRLEPSRPAINMTVRAGGGTVTYATYVEYGTMYSPAQPYLTPAARAIDVRKEVAAELNRLIRSNAL